MIATYVEALAKAPPPRVVALSSMGANRTSGLGMITALSLLEQGFRNLTSPVAFVRAGGFFENFLYGLHVAQGGMLPVYYNPTNRKSTMVATNDIGAEVATLLTGPAWPGHRVIELGSMLVSADEVAEQLGEVLKREVKAFAVPRAGWAAAFEQFGVPKGRTGPAEDMFEAVNAGWMDLGVEDVEHVAGATSRARRLRGGNRRPRRREPRRSHQGRRAPPRPEADRPRREAAGVLSAAQRRAHFLDSPRMTVAPSGCIGGYPLSPARRRSMILFRFFCASRRVTP